MNSIKTNAHFRSAHGEEKNRSPNNNDHTAEYTKCYVPRPFEANETNKPFADKCLYQSRSSARLRPMLSEDEIEREVVNLK